MKITAVDPFIVPPGWLFVRVRTDEGITGWGEAGASAHHPTVAAAVRELSEFLVGEPASRIEHHWQTMRRVGFFRGGPIASSAAAGIDCALWDIAGKARGVPVHELLGGPVCDSVRAFAVVSDADEARDRVAEGFTAVTLRLGDDSDAARALLRHVEAVRAAIGPDNDLAVDCGGRMSFSEARHVLPRLEPFRLFVLNEPVAGAPPRVLADLAGQSSVPLSVGQRLYSRWDLEPVLTSGLAGIDVDVAAAGGISETRRVASLAETHLMRTSLAVNRGPLALAAALQLSFTTASNVELAWNTVGLGARGDYLSSPPIQVADGCYERPNGRGLGVAIDEAAVVSAAF